MANLRRKLEPDPSRPRYLITEPSIGYRFHAGAKGMTRTSCEGTSAMGGAPRSRQFRRVARGCGRTFH
jgi:hypothetical protein